MDLTFEQIASAVQGAARVENGSDGIAFYRFTEEQEALYRREHPNHLNTTFTSAGVTIAFRTNSESLTLSALLAKAISRNFYSFDVTVNDRLAGYMDNVDLPEAIKCYRRAARLGYPRANRKVRALERLLDRMADED